MVGAFEYSQVYKRDGQHLYTYAYILGACVCACAYVIYLFAPKLTMFSVSQSVPYSRTRYSLNISKA